MIPALALSVHLCLTLLLPVNCAATVSATCRFLTTHVTVPTKVASETSPGVWTQTGFRPSTQIDSMLQLWDTTFGTLLSGIFVDEVSNRWSAVNDHSWGDHILFYQAIFQTIRTFSKGAEPWLVVSNSGGVPPNALVNGPASGGFDTQGRGADVAVVFESSAAKWDPTLAGISGETCVDQLWTRTQGSFDAGPWCPLVPVWDGADSFVTAASAGELSTATAALVYGADASEGLGNSVEQARTAQMRYLYVTEQPQAAPWSSLTGSWAQLLQAIGSGSPSVGCDGVKEIYTAEGCCGQSGDQSLDILVSFPAGNDLVSPTCADLKGLYQQESCCPLSTRRRRSQATLPQIWCNATNCTDLFG